MLIDLKIGDLTHQDLGQMQMYVHYYERELMMERYGAFIPCGAVSLTYMDEKQGSINHKS